MAGRAEDLGKASIELWVGIEDLFDSSTPVLVPEHLSGDLRCTAGDEESIVDAEHERGLPTEEGANERGGSIDLQEPGSFGSPVGEVELMAFQFTPEPEEPSSVRDSDGVPSEGEAEKGIPGCGVRRRVADRYGSRRGRVALPECGAPILVRRREKEGVSDRRQLGPGPRIDAVVGPRADVSEESRSLFGAVRGPWLVASAAGSLEEDETIAKHLEPLRAQPATVVEIDDELGSRFRPVGPPELVVMSGGDRSEVEVVSETGEARGPGAAVAWLDVSDEDGSLGRSVRAPQLRTLARAVRREEDPLAERSEPERDHAHGIPVDRAGGSGLDVLQQRGSSGRPVGHPGLAAMLLGSRREQQLSGEREPRLWRSGLRTGPDVENAPGSGRRTVGAPQLSSVFGVCGREANL